MTICKEKLSPKACRDIFVLTYDRMRQYEGTWHLERHLLFPEYVILESGNEEVLLEELEKRCDFARREQYLVRVGAEEEKILRNLCGKEHHLEMSRGIIREGNAQVTDGPLKGMEHRIRRIDRHKRLAKIEIAGIADDLRHYRKEAWCRYIPAGLEITEKSV